MAVIKLNNELRELELQERKEIEMVLAALSMELVPYVEPIRRISNPSKAGLYFAKGALSRSYRAVCPFHQNGYMRSGRPPSAAGSETVVPINIWLGKDFDL